MTFSGRHPHSHVVTSVASTTVAAHSHGGVTTGSDNTGTTQPSATTTVSNTVSKEKG